MLIKMLHGTFGAKENGIIVAKTNKSDPFRVEDERGRALIASGYAREVTNAYPVKNNGQTDTAEDRESDEADIDNYSLQDLRKLAKEMGLNAGGSRKEILDRIKEKLGEDSLPEEEGTSPLLTASEPEG